MAFTWNAWSRVNLGIDLFFLATAAFVAWRTLSTLPENSRPGSGPTAKALARAAGLALLPWCAGSILLGGILGLSLLARTLWTFATVALPAVAALLAWRRRRLWLLALGVGLLSLKFYGEVWEPGALEVERVRVPLAGLKAPVRLVHLSDLQTDGIGPMQLAAREAANAFDPDVVAFTGDVANYQSLIPAISEYLRGFRHRRSAPFRHRERGWDPAASRLLRAERLRLPRRGRALSRRRRLQGGLPGPGPG